MDFRDVRCGMCQVRDGLTDALAALRDCGDTFWRQSPKSGYGPGELIVHIVQVASFTREFVQHQMSDTTPDTFVLPENLRTAVQNLGELRRVNLAAARASFGRVSRSGVVFPGQFEDFRVWTVRKGRGIYDWVSALPDQYAHRRISHPLVEMECGAATMLYRQFVVHSVYHLGQLTQQMKDAGYADRVPHLPIFGRFGTAVATA